MKNLIYLAITLTILGAGGYYYWSTQKVKKYEQGAQESVQTMLLTAQLGESVIDLYSTVWRNAIYKEGGYFNRESEYYLKDFNEALSAAQANSVKSTDMILKSTMHIDSLVKSLNDPPAKYQALHVKLIDLYGIYNEYVSLAIAPKGSLTSFNDKTNELSSALLKVRKEILVQMPDQKIE
ncbi:hypothetical protein [Dyadobacter bucti]|uniref:hypothetical protein n=1 Tax=Dyadobacter bucti TaxID=2572203 RepID=UPI001108B0CB|nr:hypothetical protein [Dyadobacter bucti]